MGSGVRVYHRILLYSSLRLTSRKRRSNKKEENRLFMQGRHLSVHSELGYLGNGDRRVRLIILECL